MLPQKIPEEEEGVNHDRGTEKRDYGATDRADRISRIEPI
jgi:hypothetical protein